MLAKFITSFKILGLGRYFQESKAASSKNSIMVVVGLEALVQISNWENSNFIVIKSAIQKFHLLPPASTIELDCYLKSCYLCNKNLSVDKDVYMYRGDQGFCSIECRNRQIVLDEIQESEEVSTKQRRKSCSRRYYCAGMAGRNETRLLIEELRRRNKLVPQTKQNHWLIVS